MWPRWLPKRARLPLIAQIAGGAALVAAIAMPRWSDAPPSSITPSPHAQSFDLTPSSPPPPAHLNLDVRHAFRAVDLSLTVDGKRALDTKLPGGGKRFGMFGKRAERGFTKTLELPPGVRIVRVRVRSAPDKFDQTRVERFDLDSASVATLRVSADKSGLSIVAVRPSASQASVVAAAPPVVQAAPVTPVQTTQLQATQAQATHMVQQASALAELYKALRSMLIAMAGFVASTATAFVVQEFLKSRRGLNFARNQAVSPPQ